MIIRRAVIVAHYYPNGNFADSFNKNVLKPKSKKFTPLQKILSHSCSKWAPEEICKISFKSNGILVPKKSPQQLKKWMISWVFLPKKR